MVGEQLCRVLCGHENYGSGNYGAIEKHLGHTHEYMSKIEYQGLERWLGEQEHWLLFPRTRVLLKEQWAAFLPPVSQPPG